MSNALSAVITIVVATTATAGRSSGNVIRRKTCSSLAPSTRAASISSGLMPLSAAERMTMQKPVQIQTATMISAMVFVGASCSQVCGREPGRGRPPR